MSIDLAADWPGHTWHFQSGWLLTRLVYFWLMKPCEKWDWDKLRVIRAGSVAATRSEPLDRSDPAVATRFDWIQSQWWNVPRSPVMETKRCQTRFVSPSRFVFHLLRANGRHGDACLKVIFFFPSEFPAGNNSFPLNGTRLNFVYAVDGAPLFLSFFLSFFHSPSLFLATDSLVRFSFNSRHHPSSCLQAGQHAAFNVTDAQTINSVAHYVPNPFPAPNSPSPLLPIICVTTFKDLTFKSMTWRTIPADLTVWIKQAQDRKINMKNGVSLEWPSRVSAQLCLLCQHPPSTETIRRGNLPTFVFCFCAKSSRVKWTNAANFICSRDEHQQTNESKQQPSCWRVQLSRSLSA